MPIFTRSIVIDAAVKTVFEFHERPDALSLLSPPFPPLRVISKAGGLEAGLRVELRIGPLPWVALHIAYERNRLFVDKQIRGPFKKWVHRHEFEELGNRTRLTDRVDYSLPGGSLGERRRQLDDRHRTSTDVPPPAQGHEGIVREILS